MVDSLPITIPIALLRTHHIARKYYTERVIYPVSSYYEQAEAKDDHDRTGRGCLICIFMRARCDFLYSITKGSKTAK